MVLHPQLRAMLDAAAAAPPLVSLPLDTLRATEVQRFSARVPIVPLHQVSEHGIAGPGGAIRLRSYRPGAVADLPIVIFFHGGGFVIGGLDSHDALCRQLCQASNCLVISVEYRLAPEHKFPAAPDDCLAATLWIRENATALGGDPARMALAGDSAGGNLAIVTALRLAAMGQSQVRALCAMYPVTDHCRSGRASYAERGKGMGLTSEAMIWFWDHYLATPADAEHPHASPLRAPELRALPPTYVITAEFDPLRDEGGAFAKRAANEGVPIVHRHYGDMNHGFLSWAGLIDRSSQALEDAARWIRSALLTQPHEPPTTVEQAGKDLAGERK